MLSGKLVFDVCIFFLFKQKTAYEMRISDWSSDVCSSDLPYHRPSDQAYSGSCLDGELWWRRGDQTSAGRFWEADSRFCENGSVYRHENSRSGLGRSARYRSEEHTSELQSLMRISYAVFYLT